MDLKYRIVTRGDQDYIVPLVGESFSDNQRYYIAHTLRTNGYFISIISKGKIAYTKRTGENCKSLLTLLG